MIDISKLLEGFDEEVVLGLWTDFKQLMDMLSPTELLPVMENVALFDRPVDWLSDDRIRSHALERQRAQSSTQKIEIAVRDFRPYPSFMSEEEDFI